jgi:hypothetical protein
VTTPPDDTHARLTALAHRLARLRPDGRNPEPFYEERSELKAEALAIANGTTVTRTVTKFVRVPVPVPTPAPPPEPPPPKEGTMPLFLNAHEREILRHATTTTTGGFASGFKRWHAATDPVTGRLDLPHDDLKRLWSWGSRGWKGGAQGYIRKIFWRSVGPMITALDKVPETGDVVAKANPPRRYSKKGKPGNGAGSDGSGNTGDTPPQDAPEGHDTP